MIPCFIQLNNDKAVKPVKISLEPGFSICNMDHDVIIGARETIAIDTGLSLTIPSGYFGQTTPAIWLSLCEGIHYMSSGNIQGSLHIILFNPNKRQYILPAKMKIANMIIHQIPEVEICIMDKIIEENMIIDDIHKMDDAENNAAIQAFQENNNDDFFDTEAAEAANEINFQ